MEDLKAFFTVRPLFSVYLSLRHAYLLYMFISHIRSSFMIYCYDQLISIHKSLSRIYMIDKWFL